MPEAITSKLGEMKYLSTLTKKDSNFKLKMLTNRIERLKYEERRANMKIKHTKNKTENFISTRNKHYEEKKRVLNFQLKMENDISSKRQQIIENNILKKRAMEELK